MASNSSGKYNGCIFEFPVPNLPFRKKGDDKIEEIFIETMSQNETKRKG